MTDPEQTALAAAKARISELELHLELRRQESDSMRAQLARVTGSRAWRTLAMLRRTGLWLRGKGGSSQEAAAVIVDDIPQAVPAGPAADFLALLPAEAVIPADSPAADPHQISRRVDFASTMASVLPPAARGGFGGVLPESGPIYFGETEPALHIGYVGSDELLRQIAFDAQVTRIRAACWQQQLQSLPASPHRLDFLLVEAIHHREPGDWRDAFAADGMQRKQFLDMLSHCRAHGVPVVCWFRESVASLDDWAWLAPGADALFAHDPVAVARLQANYPLRPVQWMPPAIQPRLHHPASVPALLKAASWAGSRVLYEGQAACHADGTLPPGLDALGDILLLGDSQWDATAGQLRDQPEIARMALGTYNAADRNAMLRLVGAEYFRHGKTAAEQQRQLEAAACGALVIGPGALSWLAIDGDQAAETWRATLTNPIQRARSAHLKTRLVLSRHGMADRLQTMLDALGIGTRVSPPAPKVACLLVTRRPALLDACLRRFRADLYPHKELVVVVHDNDADLRDIRRSIGAHEPIRILRLGEQYGLGACLNFAFEHTDATYWAKWDDDDYYGPHYLSDFMLYRRAIDFDIAGKPMAFTWLDEAAELLWDERWGARTHVLRTAIDSKNAGVAGATLMGHRRVLESTPFPDARRRGTDSEFLRRSHERGWNLLATDPFNFVRYRTTREGFHTWQMTSNSIRDRTIVVGHHNDIAAQAFV